MQVLGLVCPRDTCEIYNGHLCVHVTFLKSVHVPQWEVLGNIVHKLFSWLNHMKMNPNGLFRHLGSPKKLKGQ